MNVTQLFCDADDFCQEFIPILGENTVGSRGKGENKGQGAFSL